MTPGIPPAEVAIDEGVVRGLLRSQCPHLAELPLRLAATGWDNATFRLGEKLAVRMPRITAAAELLRNELRWLPALAGWLPPAAPISIPVPIWSGQPGEGYPWQWSVMPWIPGRSGEHGLPSSGQARAFGEFLAALHRPAPDGFPRNSWRGVPLRDVAGDIEPSLVELCQGMPWFDTVSRLWREALDAPLDVAEVCVHGDLHPKNIVVDQGRMVAVIDWGDMTVGDPAIDLAAAWMLFPPAAHAEIWRGYGQISASTMARARGWAVFFGVTTLRTGIANDPPFAAIGGATLERLNV